jgi:hypothetical protein
MFELVSSLDGVIAADPAEDVAANRKQVETWLKDPERSEDLKRNLAAYKALPQETRARLKQLDQSLHELNDEQHNRMRDVMGRYAIWYGRLPKEDRARIAAAPSGPERLKIVDEILDRQWQASLPKPDRERLAQASPEDRAKMLGDLRRAAENGRRFRAEAHRAAVEESLVAGLPGSNEFRDRIQICIDESLRPLLTEKEEERLNEAPPRSFRFFSVLNELSEGKFPLEFPGPAPAGKNKAIRYWHDLPPQIADKLPTPAPQAITKEEGKWPAFPKAVVEYARANKIDIPTNMLGPTRAEEMPPSVQRMIKDDLLAKLNDNEQRQLKNAEGKWPNYPRVVKQFADRHRVRIPGMVLVLPGERNAWQRMRDYKPPRPGPN